MPRPRPLQPTRVPYRQEEISHTTRGGSRWRLTIEDGEDELDAYVLNEIIDHLARQMIAMADD